MPTYFATGITATLKICDLQDSVSNIIDLKCGLEQRNDATRIKNVLEAATPLAERTIGTYESAYGIVQHIGPQSDMPIKTAEACMRFSESPKSRGPDEDDVDQTNSAKDQEANANATPSSSLDSPLTSLGATPTPTQLSLSSSPAKTAMSAKKSTPSKIISQAIERLPSLGYVAGPQALVLDITLTSKSFMPVVSEVHRGKSATDNKDLKIEVFLNGELVEVDFVSGRRLTRGTPQIVLQYKGTRLHRQTEKPWAYLTPQYNTYITDDAQDRYVNVSLALKLESEMRGRDRYGDVAPSAEYLLALSQVALPTRMKAYKGLGVVDVIITAGRGQKYGSECEYHVAPTRFDDPAYTTLNPLVDPEIVLERTRTSPLTPSNNIFVYDGDSSPEIPLAQLRTRATKFTLTNPVYRSQKTKDELAKDLGLKVNPKKTIMSGFENAHGTSTPKGRSLDQRLGDIQKMAPKNQVTEIENLREEFGTPAVLAVAVRSEPPKKKLRVNVPDYEYTANTLAALAAAATGSPVDMFKLSTPTRLLMQTMSEATDNNVDLAQGDRIDSAREAGADQDDHLMQTLRESVPSPETVDQQALQTFSTPQKRTKASALANSPARVPVKIPKSQRNLREQQQARLAAGELDDSPIPFTLGEYQPTMNQHAATKASRPFSLTLSNGTPSRGANRTAKKWLPNERTAAEALTAFEVPAASVGSCVTYAPDLGVIGGGGAALGGKVQRQIGKTRTGEFREQEVVVGFRFFVV